ncbi:MAG TPA: hypothetical protein VH278_04720 [Burkholderiaceae bacterium]|nr:hypothetical protein [Burkholderiaceae bacterium]
MNSIVPRLSAAAAALSLGLAIAAGAAQPDPGATAARASPGPDLTESDMGHTGSDGTVTVPWDMLGGVVGNQTVNGLRVGLYVLQAQDPAKLKPGDPNHAFTVTLKDDKSGALVKQGDVSIVVLAEDVVQRGSMAVQPNGLFRLGVRLPRTGDYRVKIAFKAGGRAGQVEFPYVFRLDPQPMPAHQH